MKMKRSTSGAQPANKALSGATLPRIDEGRLAKVLIAPVVNEKAARVGEKRNQVLFRVLRDATKPEIKAAVELMFKVEIASVTRLNQKDKTKRFDLRRHRVLKPALASTRIASEDLDAAVQSVSG